MKLAINYSKPAASLVQSQQIMIDYFKTPEWEWMIDEAQAIKDVKIHFTLDAGNQNLGEVDWVKISRIAEQTGTPYINLHLDARGTYYPGMNVDSQAGTDRKQVIDAILSDVTQVVNVFGSERVIVENSPYRAEPGGTLRLSIEPDLIAQVLQKTGCGLLLDISHAIISAKTIGMEPGIYLNRLPVDRLKEMHFAGVHQNLVTGQWMDHLSIVDEDWYWLDWVLDRISAGGWSAPWMLAFEYGGVGEPFEWRTNPEVIAEQVPLLYERVSTVNF